LDLDCGWTWTSFNKQDWSWIANYDNPLISDQDLIWSNVMGKKWGCFALKRLHFANVLDLDFSFEKTFGLLLDLD